MTAQVAASPSTTNSSTDDDLDHIVCCDDNRTLCGIDATEIPWNDDPVILCVVCDDLNQGPCDCQPQSGNPA